MEEIIDHLRRIANLQKSEFNRAAKLYEGDNLTVREMDLAEIAWRLAEIEYLKAKG